MGEQQPAKERIRRLSEAANDITIDSNIPIRRYFRSGQEMIKMGRVYEAEGNLEAAYVLYLKYITLFLEKIKTHRDYVHVLPSEKKAVTAVIKTTISLTEDLKVILRLRYEREHEAWLEDEEARSRQRDLDRRRELEEKEARVRDELEKTLAIERDRQLAIWHQAQIDKELEEQDRLERGQESRFSSEAGGFSPPAATSLSEYRLNDFPAATFQPSVAVPQPAPRPSLANKLPSPSAPPADDPAVALKPAAAAGVPSFDRSVKPATISNTLAFGQENSSRELERKASVPCIPDRSTKPALFGSSGKRTVVVPESLMTKFLAIASQNSAKNIETLGTLGGKLSNNRFTITHLLIPKQSGKSDSCDMEGLEDVWDIHDKEDIILLGWIHTHPAYDVFLSSVDMHNQYEYQNMLPEVLAIVCSIKCNETGFLSLTDHGMQEIGSCQLKNFHPHSKDPPLFQHAEHAQIDNTLDVIVRDLRY